MPLGSRKRTGVATGVFTGPMTMAAQYRPWSSGLSYNARTEIGVSGKGPRITISTFNYLKQ
ncbi:MAG: hypothetical protein ABSC19_04640 [Syntrophorhabdales bacterium]